MMLVAQIIKHVDRHTPVRFLIAETETGYTLPGRALAGPPVRLRRPHRDQPAVRDRRCARARRAHPRGSAAQPALPRLPAPASAALPAVRLLRFRPLCRPARRQLPRSSGLKLRRRTHGAPRAAGRRGGPVRHPWREHRPRRPSRHRCSTACATSPRPPRARPWPRPACRPRGKRVPGRRRLSAVRHAGARAGHHRPDRRARLRPTVPDATTRSTASPTSPPSSSPPFSRCRAWSRIPATPPCSARSARRCSTRPARAPAPASPTRAGPPRSAIRASCARSQQRHPAAARLVRQHAAGRGRCRGPRSRNCSPRCARAARASAARSTSPSLRCRHLGPRRAARRRLACSTRAAGSTGPPTRRRRRGPRSWPISPPRSSRCVCGRRRRRCSAGSRPTTSAARAPGRSAAAWAARDAAARAAHRADRADLAAGDGRAGVLAPARRDARGAVPARFCGLTCRPRWASWAKCSQPRQTWPPIVTTPSPRAPLAAASYRA